MPESRTTVALAAKKVTRQSQPRPTDAASEAIKVPRSLGAMPAGRDGVRDGSVSIERADNGFVVRGSHMDGPTYRSATLVAGTPDQAQEIAARLLGGR